MKVRGIKVGEVAKRTGVTVRTLHHYDEAGLLRPSARTLAGHRLYTLDDIRRLRLIIVLRRLEFSLEQIGQVLGRPAELKDVVERHVKAARAEAQHARWVYEQLEALHAQLKSRKTLTLGSLLDTIKEVAMYENHFTPEQLDRLRARVRQLGPDAMGRAVREWTEIVASVRTEYDKGTDPRAPNVQALAKKWEAVVEGFTAGDSELRRGLGQFLYRSGVRPVPPSPGADVDFDLFKYVAKALSGARAT